jgi:ribonuclease E
MTTRMLIDARHPEETRVAVLKGNRIEEFDFDSAEHKQIKGNIYLAKVTRVEPSLQAAFVDFGGNRHGFLAFSEIHPDYYQIPKEDREQLLAEEAAAAEEEAALRAEDEADGEDYDSADGHDDDDDNVHDEGGVTEIDTSEKDHVDTIDGGAVENGYNNGDQGGEEETPENGSDEENGSGQSRHGRRRQGRGGGRGKAKAADDLRDKRMALRRRYKIQDVVHRRQVLLVQVVKEERGNKGAALTTYLSLAGRYCVLMPNSSHGGGISRKINSSSDRKRLKSIIAEMDLPKSMGCIVRTAGLSRTKVEIKRDFDYLARLWDEIRENTLNSSAPALIHSDSDLIKRAIRDIYNKEIEDIVVEGEGGYRAARDFMKLLMPSHVKRVKAYSDPVPLFQRYGAEDQLTAMYDPFVQLKSGGYIVINPTEALVSIDINSGRSTKEHGIEATALNTNLEAAREIARQLRLRDMAGLVVIDFIDMDYGSNVRKVEKAMRDALKNDRARIQVGRISSFGLMEMSRQRLRTGVLEATTRSCPHCDGTGLVRTAGSAGLAALRVIEDEAASGKGTTISLYASQEATVYVLNHKRADLVEIEQRYGVKVEVFPEGENEGSKMRVASSGPRNEFVPQFGPIEFEDDDDDVPVDEYEEDEEESRANDEADRDEEGARKRRSRRRGRGRDRDRGRDDDPEAQTNASEAADANDTDERDEPSDATEDGEGPRKRRRRGRRKRGGRGRGDGQESENAIGSESADEEATPAITDDAVPAELAEVEAPKKRSRRKVVADETPVEAAPPEPVADEAATKPKRTRRKAIAETATDEAEVASPEPVVAEPEAAEPAPAKPAARGRRKKAEPEPTEGMATDDASSSVAGQSDSNSASDTTSPRRGGWWQRTFGA